MGTARYTIEVGDERIEFEGPDNLTDSQIEKLANTELKKAKPGQSFSASHYVGIEHPDEPPAAPEHSTLGSFFRNLPHDAFLNFDDEIAAAGNAAIPGMAALDNASGINDGEQQSMWGSNSKGFWDTFKQNMANLKSTRQADDDQHPMASSAGRVAGVLSTIPTIGKTIAAKLPQAIKTIAEARPIATGVTIGGVTGAASGAGAGEGNRGQSAALGGLTGAALGGALSAGIEAAPAVANYVKLLFNKGQAATERALAQLTTALKRDGYDVTDPNFVQQMTDAVGAYTGKPVTIADLGNATRARAGVGLRTPSDQQIPAIDRITERAAGQSQRLAGDIRTNVAPRTDVHALNEDLVAQRASEAEKLRQAALFQETPQQELLHRGGAPFDPNHPGPTYFTPDRNAAESYVGMHEERFGTPGVTESFTHDLKNPLDLSSNTVPDEEIVQLARQAGIDADNLEYGTTSSWFDPALNPPGASQRLIAELKKRGYDGVRTMDVPWSGSGREEGQFIDAVIPFDNRSIVPVGGGAASSGVVSRMIDDPQLQNLARLPLAQKALKAAVGLIEAERGRLAATGQDISHLPDITQLGQNLDMRGFDALKRFLDDEVSRLYKGDTGTFQKAQLNEVKALRDTIRDRLKSQVPEYTDYLNAYRGSSEMIDALDAGQKFDSLAPEQIAAEQAGRSTAAQELYRVGTARNLLDTIRSTRDGRTPADRILNSDEARSQLAATGVDPAQAEALNRSVQQERVLSLLPREMQGSQTQTRQMAQEDANGSNLHLPWNPASKFSWAGAILRGAIDKISLARNAQVNEALLPRITDPSAVMSTIKELEDHGNVAAARALRRQFFGYKVSGAAGTTIGGPVALPQEEY